MSNGRTSIRDVAQESGVSLTTVSLVLNRNDERISESTRKRVLEAIDRLSYTPSRLARGLPNRRANTLAVLVPALKHALADVYFGEIISGIYDTAADAGFRILLEVARPEYIERQEYLTLLDDCSVDGILFVGSTEEHTWLSDFDGGVRPLVVVNNHFSQWKLHHVVCDYAKAGRLAADYLADLGHTRIAHITGPSEMVLTSRELTDGFLKQLADRGIPIPENQIAPGEFLVETGEHACTQLLDQVPDLTAIFAANDKMALGSYRALRQRGLAPGRDVAVLGCDDLPAGSIADPGLSTIRLDYYGLGVEACQMMLNVVSEESAAGNIQSRQIDVELVPRGSCNESPGPSAG